MQKNLVGRVAKLEKELSDLAVIYEHDRTKKITSANQQSHLHDDTCKVINVQGIQKVEASHLNSPTRKPRKRSQSRTKRTQHSQQEPEIPNKIILEQPKRVAVIVPQQSRQITQNAKFSPSSLVQQHPDGKIKTMELKKKLVAEMEKSEQAYKIIDGLKEELHYSKARMSTMAQDVQILMQALEGMQNKYKNIKSVRKEKLAQIDELKKINTELCKALDQEIKKHADIVNDLKSYSCSIEDVKTQKRLADQLKITLEQYEKLKDIHGKLKNTCQDLQTKYERATQDIDKLRIEIGKQAKVLIEKNQEIENLKLMINNEKSKNTCIYEAVDKLEVKVKEMLVKEMNATKEIQALKHQIQTLEDERLNHNAQNYHREKDFKQMETECESLQKELAELNSKDINKCKMIEKEIDKLKSHMKNKEKKIIEERDHLKSLVDELSSVVQKHKHRIKELVSINRQQETLLKNQVVMMQNKEHSLKIAEVEVEAARKRAYILEEQIDKLRHSMKIYANVHAKNNNPKSPSKSKHEILQDELQTVRTCGRQEEDRFSIQSKIIEDQADTIRKLKCSITNNGNETQKQNMKILYLQKQLEQAKLEKRQLVYNIDNIEQQKSKLKEKISNLEISAKAKDKSTVKFNSKMKQQNVLLDKLEERITLKQREWELRSKLLNNEKELAVHAAKFATQKLVDTVNDFQSQTDNHKTMQILYTKMAKK